MVDQVLSSTLLTSPLDNVKWALRGRGCHVVVAAGSLICVRIRVESPPHPAPISLCFLCCLCFFSALCVTHLHYHLVRIRFLFRF